MFVLDTDVVSELRKVAAGKGHRQVAAWSEQVTLGETFLAAMRISTPIGSKSCISPKRPLTTTGYLPR